MEQKEQLEVTTRTSLSTLKKFPTLFSEPLPRKVCCSGSPIYEWDYLDGNGELQHDKTNLQEMIQSYERQVCIKERIKRGEQLHDGNYETGVYMDISQLGDGYTDLDRRLRDLRQDLENMQVSAQNGRAEGEPDVKPGEETPGETPKNPQQEEGGDKQ